jgi:GNAT superfamily N-acetyltransferase
MLIRDLGAEDWPQVYPFFRSIVSAGETYAYPEALGLEEAQRYWVTPAPGKTVVADDHGTVVGTATMGPNRPGRGAHIATASFMVAPDSQGRGVGRALGEYVIDWATDAGYLGIQFNAVVETNAPAVHLWQWFGFSILATVPQAFDHPEHGLVGLHVMFRPLVT